MDLEALKKEGGQEELDDGEVSRSQTKLAELTSHRADPDDSYPDLGDWDITDAQINLAYKVSKGRNLSGHEGLVRKTVEKLAPSASMDEDTGKIEPGSKDEWYALLQVNLAHYFADELDGKELPRLCPTIDEEVEAEGATPLMEQLGFDAEHIYGYMQDNPEVMENFREILQDS